jgi:GTPase
LCSRTIQDENICPLFLVSSKTGAGLDLFKAFLNLLPININSQMWKKDQNDNAEFHITETFGKNGDYILSGMLVSG